MSLSRSDTKDNLNWAGFRLAEKDNLRDVEIKEVNKMLSFAASSHTSVNPVEPKKQSTQSHLHEFSEISQKCIIQCASPTCGAHDSRCSVAHCEEESFSQGFDGCGNCSYHDTISYKHRNGRLTYDCRYLFLVLFVIYV